MKPYLAIHHVTEGKKKLIFVAAIITFLLSGCLQMFSPTVVEISPGVYRLHAQSNAFGSREVLKSKLNYKAEEICKDKGFDELDSNNNIINHHKVYESGLLIPVDTKAAIMTIKCKD